MGTLPGDTQLIMSTQIPSSSFFFSFHWNRKGKERSRTKQRKTDVCTKTNTRISEFARKQLGELASAKHVIVKFLIL